MQLVKKKMLILDAVKERIQIIHCPVFAHPRNLLWDPGAQQTF